MHSEDTLQVNKGKEMNYADVLLASCVLLLVQLMLLLFKASLDQTDQEEQLDTILT